MAKFHKGKYVLKNPDKYLGNKDNIVYRSSWEKTVMINLDTNPNVWKWTSEETVIPYISPIDNRPHKYFMDFTVFYFVSFLIHIKHQTVYIQNQL